MPVRVNAEASSTPHATGIQLVTSTEIAMVDITFIQTGGPEQGDLQTTQIPHHAMTEAQTMATTVWESIQMVQTATGIDRQVQADLGARFDSSSPPSSTRHTVP